MSFIPVKSDSGALQPWEYLPVKAGDYQLGQLLSASGGKLTAITAASTAEPPYVSMADKTAAEGEDLPVIRVRGDRVFETTLSAAVSTAAVGGRLQIAAGGLEAASGSGAFEIVSLEGTEKGSVVRGRFVGAAASAS